MDECRRRGEIITLQVGRYANFVGTHFWNFQDELVLLASRGGVVDAPYDHGVLHRPAAEQQRGYGGGRGEGGGQRTPRLVAFDTRDALGSLNPLGLVGGGDADATATEEAAMSSWGGGVSVFRQPTFQKNALHEYLDNEDTATNTTTDAAAAAYVGAAGFGGDGGWGEKKAVGEEQAESEDEEMKEAKVTGDLTRLSKHPFGLDDTVNSWPDFLKSILHQKALQELPFRDESSDFGLYTSGVGGGNGALDESNRDKHSDMIRRQLEECDAAQGTQTLVDLEGGWGGLGTSLAKELEEECRNRPRVSYAFLRRCGAPTGPGCRIPGAMGGGGGGAGEGVGGGGMSGGAGAARAAVNLALGLHGLTESFTLSFVLDEEACSKEISAHMAIDPVNAYHTSAVLGAALDVATSPLRFSSTGLDAWASSNSGGGGGIPMAGGGGAFGGGGRARAPGPDMTLATLSACLPLPYPDASADTLKRLLSGHTSSPHPSSSSSAPRDARGESPVPLYSTASSTQSMVSLGPVARRRGTLLRRGRGKTMAAGSGRDGDAVVYSSKTVWRGFTGPRDQQLQALEQILHHSGVGSGCSYSVSTPLPIPITYPLLFRESLGLRGELLSTPPLIPMPPPPPHGGSGSTSTSEGAAASVSAGGEGGRAGEMRVMCDQISGVACAERNSSMGSFIGQVAAGLDLRRGGVLLELEKNDMHKDDAIEVLESLTGLAESYGFSQDEEEEGDEGA